MKIALLLSGGVDSSTALWRLKDAGHLDITAYYLKIWLEDELSYMGSCPWEEDLEYARAVCLQAGVPLNVVSLQLEYYERVVAYALEELRAGRTPSPDIFCNQRIKFGAFFEHFGESFDRLATGHYARIEESGGLSLLKRAPDPVKDQTYFLSHLSQEQVSRSMFPIGDMMKSEVRALAHALELPNRDRKDSQGICFLGRIRYPEFIRHYLGERGGRIVELESRRVLGHHKGYWFHTVGQRSGLGLGNGPWYVVAKDTIENVIYVSHELHAAERARKSFRIGRLNWIGRKPEPTESLYVKIRHGPELTRCAIRVPVPEAVAAPVRGYASPDARPVLDEADAGETLDVVMERPDRGVAPGQFAVLYSGDVCLGGGMILEDPCEY
ncbi:MAG TPA: tRNA 2-thiouridine(34) synthase MnmA [Spirochaetia bacterium]|nr:tRNA 2-thiouridine(34) synthase MnmA [Spirochaetia bacterium]